MDANIGFFSLECMMFKLPVMKAGGFADRHNGRSKGYKKARFN